MISPPPAIFEHQSDVIEFSNYFFGCKNKVIKGFKFFVSPVSNFINTFQGTMKNQKCLQICQNLVKFPISNFISRNTHFLDMQPWDQKVLKLRKETFCKLRINIRAIHRAQGKFQILQKIVKFRKLPSDYSAVMTYIYGPPGENRNVPVTLTLFILS